MLLTINFLQYQPLLQLSKSGETTLIFDPIRRKNLVLTPEELLRQLVVLYLLEGKNYNPARLRTEMGITVNGLQKRCDIIAFDADLQPWLLVECKSPKITMSQAVMEQAARYNLRLQVPFMAVTNGLATFSCALDYADKSYAFLEDFPDWA